MPACDILARRQLLGHPRARVVLLGASLGACLIMGACEGSRSRTDSSDAGGDQGSGGGGGAGGQELVQDAAAPDDTADAAVTDALLADDAVDGAQPPRIPDCSDDNPCTVDTFDGVACVHTAVVNGTPCDDGNLCTTGDSCQVGACVAGTATTTTLQELGRLDTFGTDHGAVIPIQDGRFVYADYGALHVVRFDGSAPLIETALHFADGTLGFLWNPYLTASSTTTPRAGWAGHLALQAGGGLTIMTLDDQGGVSASGVLEPPLSAGFIAGTLYGVAGHGNTVWFCMDYSFFSGVWGQVFGYDVTDPSAPVQLAAADIPAPCGSVAVSSGGNRVYANTTKGIYWFDPSVTDAANNNTVVVNGPFGENSGLAVYGDVLVARGTANVTLYDEAIQSALLVLDAPGVIGASYLPAERAVAVLRQTTTDPSHTERVLELHDAEGGSGGALLDRVSLGWEWDKRAGEGLPTGGGVVIDPRTKAAFRVTNRSFQRLSTPMVGGISLLANTASGLRALSPSADLQVDLTDPAAPAWQPGGGPVLGRTRVTALDMTAPTPVLVREGDPSYWRHLIADRLVVDRKMFLLQLQSSIYLVLRQTPGVATAVGPGRLLLPGTDLGMLQWSGDSLYRLSPAGVAGLRLQRWDRGLLVPSDSPLAPREDIVLPLSNPIPADASSVTAILDFPSASDTGLAVLKFWAKDPVTQVSYTGNRLVWFRRSGGQVTVVDELTADNMSRELHDCRVAGRRAVCTDGSSELLMAERGLTPGAATFKVVPLAGNDRVNAILAFDGERVLGAGQNADAFFLAMVPFDVTSATLDASPKLSFSTHVSSVAQLGSFYAAASEVEVVTFTPQCAVP